MTNQTVAQTLLNIADLAEIRDNLREELRKVQDEARRIKALIDENEGALMAILDDQGVTLTGVGPYTMSVTENTVAYVEDWDSLHSYIVEKEAFHLLQRRVSNAAYREILYYGESVRGVTFG